MFRVMARRPPVAITITLHETASKAQEEIDGTARLGLGLGYGTEFGTGGGEVCVEALRVVCVAASVWRGRRSRDCLD